MNGWTVLRPPDWCTAWRADRGAELERLAERARAEHRGEALARGDDALLEELPILRDRAQLALALVEIDPYATHGWPPGWLLRHGHRDRA